MGAADDERVGMGSLAAFTEAAGEGFVPDLFTILRGLDGLVALASGSVGEVIGARGA